MPQINVTINGRSFRMACDDGEEDRLIGLASRFDGWISELRGAFGEIGDQRLMVMAGIMATDQLSELEKKVSSLEAELAGEREKRQLDLIGVEKTDESLAEALEAAAVKIEELAQGLGGGAAPE